MSASLPVLGASWRLPLGQVVSLSRQAVSRWGKLAVIVAAWGWLTATVAILAWLSSIWLSVKGSLNNQMDSGAFLNAAHAWPFLYSSSPATFLSPPLVALVSLPFLHVPLSFEPLAWRLALVLALVLAWKLAELKHSPRLWLLVLLGNPITLFTLTQGQITPFALLGLSASAWFWRRGRLLEAGIILALAAQTKPTLFIALPLALLAANQARLLFGLVIGTLGICLLYTLLLGPSWLPGFIGATVSDHQNLLSAESNTVASLGILAWVFRIAILVLVPLVAWRQRSRPNVAIIVALVGSLVLTPYLHQEDLLVVFMIAWLFARTHGPHLAAFICATGLLAAFFFSPPLMLTWEFGVILLATQPWRPRPLPLLSPRLLVAPAPGQT